MKRLRNGKAEGRLSWKVLITLGHILPSFCECCVLWTALAPGEMGYNGKHNYHGTENLIPDKTPLMHLQKQQEAQTTL